MIEVFKHKAIKQFKIKYEKLVKHRKFEDFFRCLSSDLDDIFDIEKRELVMKSINSNVKRTKTRWVKKYLESPDNKFAKDIEFAELQYKKVLAKQITAKKFKSYFDVKTLNEW